MKIRITDGVREVEVDDTGGDKCSHDLEALAVRLYDVVSKRGGPAPIGFTSGTTSDHERSWQEE